MATLSRLARKPDKWESSGSSSPYSPRAMCLGSGPLAGCSRPLRAITRTRDDVVGRLAGGKRGVEATGDSVRARTPMGLLVMRTVLIADDESSIRLLVHATIESDD